MKANQVKANFKSRMIQEVATRKRQMEMAKELSKLPEVLKVIEALSVLPTEIDSFSTSPWSIDVNFYVGSVEEYTELMRAALAAVEKAGYKHVYEPVFLREGYEFVRIDGLKRADGSCVTMTIFVHLASGGSCELIRVGTQMIEQPIYEVRCHE